MACPVSGSGAEPATSEWEEACLDGISSAPARLLSTMAKDELANKLSRRLQVAEHNGEAKQQPQAPKHHPEVELPVLDSGADGELSTKSQWRTELNEPAQLSPSSTTQLHVSSPYTESPYGDFQRGKMAGATAAGSS